MLKWVLIGLTLIFAAGKVFGAIAWSWWMVLLPVLLPLYIAVGLILLFVAIGGLAAVCGTAFDGGKYIDKAKKFSKK